jgi:hypothetical protein
MLLTASLKGYYLSDQAVCFELLSILSERRASHNQHSPSPGERDPLEMHALLVGGRGKHHSHESLFLIQGVKSKYWLALNPLNGDILPH